MKIDMSGTVNTSLGNYCQRRSTQLSLSKIKPRMMQQVLLRNSESRHAADIHYDNCEGSAIPQGAKLMELFPQHPGFDSTSTTLTNAFNEADDINCLPLPLLGLDRRSPKADNASHFQAPSKGSPSRLTIFYNGTIDVCGVSALKAEAIMTMAAGNSNGTILQQTFPGFDHGDSSATSSSISITLPSWPSLSKKASGQVGTTDVANQTRLEISHADLFVFNAEIPVAKKLSLQRFLQKRMDRMNKPVPYTKSNLLMKT